MLTSMRRQHGVSSTARGSLEEYAHYQAMLFIFVTKSIVCLSGMGILGNTEA